MDFQKIAADVLGFIESLIAKVMEYLSYLETEYNFETAVYENESTSM